MVRETKDTCTLRLSLVDQFTWEPGQFIMVNAEIDGNMVRRAYSISSSPTRDYLEITIRQTDEPTMSKYLNERHEGDKLEIKGPYGKFIWKEGISDRVFCLGAGSGITPFRAFFEYFIDKQLDNPITLLYSCSYGDNVIFKDELLELVDEIGNGRYELSITRDPKELSGIRNGRISSDYLRQKINEFEESNFYICGAPGFVKTMIDSLVEIGINRSKIKREQWG
ncbi:MAG: ferredoxin--NADP reductase [Candidatus Kariarchaeaceae archaeon]